MVSDVATVDLTSGGPIDTDEKRMAELMKCLEYFTRLWNEHVSTEEPKADLVSMLAHGESTRNMDPHEYLGRLILLIVGGNDTTRAPCRVASSQRINSRMSSQSW